MMKKIVYAINLIIMAMLILPTAIALAVPGSITDFVGIPTDTTIYMTWVRPSTATSTLIKYSTTTYPVTTSNGTTAYNGTAQYTSLSSLTAGTTYYFSAWGYDGSDYSATATNLAITTYPAVAANTTIPINKPTIPANVAANPDTSGWSIYPFDVILDWFADPSASHGGLGMPVNNTVSFLSGLGVTMLGVGTYAKWKSFGTAWAVAMILSCGAASIGAMQWIIPIFLIITGLGIDAGNRRWG